MKTPTSYYGGKQNLITTIMPLIPEHETYTETFVGGGAIFWAKPKSQVEIINDTNRELINFYECAQNNFVELEKMVRISLHSRSMHNDATVIYNNPHMFSRLRRAWAVWVLAAQSFSSMLDGSWGYDIIKSTTSSKVKRKREDFEMLLKLLSTVEGKFLLSSYPSEILKEYTSSNDWYSTKLEQPVSVANGTGRPGKKKIEVLTANYDLS